MRICINGSQRFFFISDAVDIVALREVFVDGEYDLSVKNKPDVILDLGAHVGDTSLFYHDVYPEARIFAIEAMPETFEKLQKNVQSISNIIPLNLAVSSETGHISFYKNASSLGNSIHKREPDSVEIKIESFSLPDLIKKIGCEKIDILKFDIEGAEADLFQNIDTTTFAENYIGEIHLDLGVVSKEDFSKNFPKFDLEFSEISKGRRYLFKAKKSSHI